MIVGSVLLVIAAGVLLGLGLVFLLEPLLYSSIGVSVLAALTLVVGIRRLAAVRAGRGMIAVRPAGASARPGSSSVQPATATGRATPRRVGRATPRPVGRAAVTSSTPADGAHLDVPADSDPTVPLDEPGEEAVRAADVARLGQLDAPVVVIDGRPRYHLADCMHLLGLDSEPLSAAEAVELGFTPCALCRPATALLSTAAPAPDESGPDSGSGARPLDGS